MGMSTFISGFKPPDERWEEMKAIWEACEKADVPVPDEVYEFFDGEDPGDKPGMEVDLGESFKEWNDDFRQGYEIDVSKIPKDIKFIRVYNQW